MIRLKIQDNTLSYVYLFSIFTLSLLLALFSSEISLLVDLPQYMWDLNIDYEGYCLSSEPLRIISEVNGCAGYFLANEIRLEWLYTTIISFGLMIIFLKLMCDYRFIDTLYLQRLAAFIASPLFVAVLIESYPQTWQIAFAFFPATWTIIGFVTLGFFIAVKFEIIYLVIIREIALRIPLPMHLFCITLILTLISFDIKSTELILFLFDSLKNIQNFFKIDGSQGFGKLFFMPLINELSDYAHIYSEPHANYSDFKYVLVWFCSFFGIFVGGWLNYFGISGWIVTFFLTGIQSRLDRLLEILNVFIPFLSIVLILAFLFPINGQARNVCLFWIFFFNILQKVFPNGFHMHAIILINIVSGFYFL